jgi:dihydrofolate reductase
MRIIVSDFISLDGVVQAPGGPDEDTDDGFRHGGWSTPFFEAETMGPVLGEVMERTECLLFGRRTWDAMAAAWPGRAGDPFADQMNAVPKYVASRTLTAEDAASRWNNTTLLEGNVVAAVRELRQRAGDGGIQVWGSPSLVRQLLENDLVDEFTLMVEPILLGGGKSIFPTDGNARGLELMSMTQASTGVLICTYRRASA